MEDYKHRLLAAAIKAAKQRKPGWYPKMRDCLLMMTGPRRDGSRPLLRLIGG